MTAIAAASLAVALCAAPYLAVIGSSPSRPFAVLADRSALCAAAGAAISAFATVAQLAALATLLERRIPFAVFAAPVIGAAPWAAGEMSAGPSLRQDQAFAAALLAAYLAGIATEIAGWSMPLQGLATAGLAAAAYLCTRGEPA